MPLNANKCLLFQEIISRTYFFPTKNHKATETNIPPSIPIWTPSAFPLHLWPKKGPKKYEIKA